VTPDRPRGDTWRIDQYRTEWPRLKVYDVGNDDAGAQMELVKFAASFFNRSAERSSTRRRRRELGRLSPERRKIGYLVPGPTRKSLAGRAAAAS
jgi:hypothetical protein